MIKKLFADKEAVKYILSTGGISFLFRMIAMLLSFAIMWIMTNYYGKSVWGLYSLALTVMQITAMFFALGLPSAFVSFSGGFTNKALSKGLLIKSAKIALLSSIVPVLLFSAGAGLIATYIFEKENLYGYLLIVALGTPCMILHEIICYYFVAMKRFVVYGLSIFILPNVFLITALLLLYNNNLGDYYTFWGYVVAYLLTVIIMLVYIFGKNQKIIYPDIAKRDIFKKSFPMMMSGIFLVLLNWTDMLMLGRFETAEQIGIYNTAFKVGYLSLFFILSMNAVVQPRVSELYHQKNISEMKKVVNRATQLVIVLTLPLVFGLIFFRELLLDLFNDTTALGGVTLILVTLGGLYNAMTGNVDQILNMTNNQKSVSVIMLCGFIVNVILNLFLIPAYGIEGAATASLITNIFVNTVFVIIIKRKLGFYTFM
ncbi:flippase [Flavobacterium litorale]|uniref:Flippase n=1 Tax=Flavobacterium litorale TaxID=2856519 RepID=A0ABX8V5Z6_9FLAO|nr:flippase [Flavobacterium litorale]QYJ67553.1 flippase [Flavobacterium litorale]